MNAFIKVFNDLLCLPKHAALDVSWSPGWAEKTALKWLKYGTFYGIDAFP